MPAMMDAIRLHTPGEPSGLSYEQLEKPRPGAGEVLVRVHAAGITRDELEWPADRLPATPCHELSGVVAGVGPDVHDIAAGEPVYALSGFDRDGAAAEYAIVPSEFVAPKPVTLSHTESAAIPLAGLSAWQALFDHGNLAEGQRVLVHGAAGGVGSLAVQLARERGAHVIATVSTPDVETARALGAHEVVDHTKLRFEDVVDRADLVFDTAGGDRLERSLEVLPPGGRLVSVASEPPQERAAERGVEAIYFIVEPNRGQLVERAGLVDRGRLRPMIDEVFPLIDARQAFKRSLGRDHRGKIVLRVADEP